MNEGLKINNIRSYFSSKNLLLHDDKSILWGIKDTNWFNYAVFGGYATLDIKHFILSFSKDEIIVVGMTIMGKFTKEHTIIKQSEIEKITFLRGIFQSKLQITYNSQLIKFKIPNFVLTAKWQKKNLKSLKDISFYKL